MKQTRIILLSLLLLLGSTVTFAAKPLRVATFKVEQMECKNCEKKVQQNIRFEKGLKKFTTDVATRLVTITYDAKKTDAKRLQQAFKKFKYDATLVSDNELTEKESKK